MKKKYLFLALRYINRHPNHTIHEIDYLINNRMDGRRFIGRQLLDLIEQNLIKPTGIKNCSVSNNRSVTWKVK